MALDADAEPLTRDDIDGIIAHGDPVERMFLLRRHDLTAGQWLRLLSDGNILVYNRAWDVLRDRVASMSSHGRASTRGRACRSWNATGWPSGTT